MITVSENDPWVYLFSAITTPRPYSYRAFCSDTLLSYSILQSVRTKCEEACIGDIYSTASENCSIHIHFSSFLSML